jgi:predicted amidohydrolase
MAVDPWGTVLADLGREAPGLAVIDLDLARVAAARRQIPALATGRDVPLRRI